MRFPRRFPTLIQDNELVDDKTFPKGNPGVPLHEDVFLSGPVTERIAVLDFNPQTGLLEAGARLSEGTPKHTYAYIVDDEISRMQVELYGTVRQLLGRLEDTYVLGRRIE